MVRYATCFVYFQRALTSPPSPPLQLPSNVPSSLHPEYPSPIHSELEQDKKDDLAAAEEAKRAVYVETKRTVGDDSWMLYEHMKMELNPEKPAEEVTVTLEGGKAVKGRRYMLRPIASTEGVQPFPAKGKILVKHQGKSVEALLDLPAPITKDDKEHPAVLWVTVGILAADGLAVQIKLKKADQPTIKDKQAGVYWVYYPAGGAVTVKID